MFIESKGKDATFSLFGWGNIPGVQKMSTLGAKTMGGYLRHNEDGKLYLAESGDFEVSNFDRKKMSIDIRFNFEMAPINLSEPLDTSVLLMMQGEIKEITIDPILQPTI